MLIACEGLPALVRLLLSPSPPHELALLGIDSIKVNSKSVDASKK